jgi:hypothetical protein
MNPKYEIKIENLYSSKEISEILHHFYNRIYQSTKIFFEYNEFSHYDDIPFDDTCNSDMVSLFTTLFNIIGKKLYKDYDSLIEQECQFDDVTVINESYLDAKLLVNEEKLKAAVQYEMDLLYYGFDFIVSRLRIGEKLFIAQHQKLAYMDCMNEQSMKILKNDITARLYRRYHLLSNRKEWYNSITREEFIFILKKIHDDWKVNYQSDTSKSLSENKIVEFMQIKFGIETNQSQFQRLIKKYNINIKEFNY